MLVCRHMCMLSRMCKSSAYAAAALIDTLPASSMGGQRRRACISTCKRSSAVAVLRGCFAVACIPCPTRYYPYQDVMQVVHEGQVGGCGKRSRSETPWHLRRSTRGMAWCSWQVLFGKVPKSSFSGVLFDAGVRLLMCISTCRTEHAIKEWPLCQ